VVCRDADPSQREAALSKMRGRDYRVSQMSWRSGPSRERPRLFRSTAEVDDVACDAVTIAAEQIGDDVNNHCWCAWFVDPD
jgi:hypothetical protein